MATAAQIVAALAPIVGKVGAAGVAGNTMQESSNRSNAPGGNLAQWQGARQVGLQTYAKSRGLDPNSDAANIGYLAQDLKGPYAGLANQLRSAKTPQQAADLFSSIYERPGTPMLANREKYAQQAFGSAGAAGSLKAPKLNGGPAIAVPTSSTQSIGPKTDVDSAIVASLLKPVSINPNGSLPNGNALLSNVVKGIDSGAFTTPAKTVTTTGETGKLTTSAAAVNDAHAAGANFDAQKLLGMLHQVQGGAYNQANHNAVAESAKQVRAQGTDCSGLISWLMGPHGLGIWSASLATPSIATAPGMQAGAGKSITVYNNKQAGNAGHVFIQIGKQFFASEGGVGIRQIPASEAANYIQHGSDGGTYQALHPKGL